MLFTNASVKKIATAEKRGLAVADVENCSKRYNSRPQTAARRDFRQRPKATRANRVASRSALLAKVEKATQRAVALATKTATQNP